MEKLLRKTYRITPEQFERLKTIANNSGTSLSAVVRDAIDAYHPDELLEAIDSELIKKVSKEVKSAIIDTRDTRKRAEKTLGEISKRRP
jgi:predicted DNA-binding protein